MRVYLCEDSLVGLLTAVFYAYYDKPNAERIECTDSYHALLGDNIKEIAPNNALARRVKSGIIKRGAKHYEAVQHVFACPSAHKFNIIYQYLRLLFSAGGDIERHTADKAYRDFDAIAYAVRHEISRLYGFIRFKELQGGAFYAYYGSDNNVLEFIMPHFVARFNVQRFLIHDLKRGLLGIYDGNTHYITAVSGETIIQTSDDEELYAELFDRYLNSVTIMSRRNTKLQDASYPKRYRFS